MNRFPARAGAIQNERVARGTVFELIAKLLRLSGRQSAGGGSLESSPLPADNAPHGLETNDQVLAHPPASGESAHPPQPDSAERGREHGLRGRAGGAGDAAGGTRPPRDATRYVQTRLGVLSYADLAPHLARNVLALEKQIEDGEYSEAALDDALLLQFHSLICGDLVPRLSGWRRTNVTVGSHTPPDFFKVPELAREYGRDFEARISAVRQTGDDTLLEALAFAEGRLLSIHPFADFNGRVTRVWLREILRRLDLPPVQLAPNEEPARGEYLAALRAADHGDWWPLTDIWRERFEKGDTE